MPYSDAYDVDDGIAIVGLAGRFPGARDAAQLWRNLIEGCESISHFREDELEAAPAEDMAARASPDYVRARGILDDVEMFDASFFGINPKEAEVIDPQQRVFLEVAWEALENAGYDPQRFAGPIGVFAGASNNYYYLHNRSRRLAHDDDGQREGLPGDARCLQAGSEGPGAQYPDSLLDLPGCRVFGGAKPAQLPVRYGAGRRGIDHPAAAAWLPVAGRRNYFPRRNLPRV
jgi:hypothetical protein